jgi:hypothetical protein
MASKIKVNTVEAESGTTVTVGQACGSVRTGSNNIQASDGGNLISQSGTTITLGASGDTISLASGASQTGFGRTGTVDWDTTKKTAAFTAVSGNGYFVDTSSAAITVTLPASPSAGDIVAVADYTRTFATNNCTLARNGSNIGGIAADAVLSTSGQSVTFVYVDSTEGWINVNDAKDSAAGTVDFMAATGGTVTTCGDFKVHTFTSPGTFCVSQVSTVDTDRNSVAYMVIAGAGGGGRSAAGGGGAGGYREGRNSTVVPYTASPKVAGTGVTVGAQSYPITVGGGGTGGTGTNSTGTNGSNSVFSTITSAGGGGGGGPGQDGGSGGGAGHRNTEGQGNTPPVTPPQGNDGGGSPNPSNNAYAGSGGGGAASAGTTATNTGNPSSGGPGGNGTPTEINGTATTRAGGGGGGAYANGGGTGSAGSGGAGAGGTSPAGSGGNGTANTGSGGGGAGSNPGPASGGSGGSGIVILRYKFQ